MEETRLLMGNEAIALGAIRAGVELVSGYPGTPSTEILETVAAQNDGSIYVEWSVNEKAAMEVAAGAAYSGKRVLVTMKQVGLNVASDPLMSLSYVGVRGGMVVVSADDPGPISSQTEQDTRHFASFSKLPVFDPSSPEEAYRMIVDAFALSEQIGRPVLFRPTTRLSHGCQSIALQLPVERKKDTAGFVRDPKKWVIFPRLSFQNHQKIVAQLAALSEELSESPYNFICGDGKKGVACGGVSYEYVRECPQSEQVRLFRVGTPYPFPEKKALAFLQGLDEVLVEEELDPVIEEALLQIVGKYHLKVKITGKLTGNVRVAGENTVESVRNDLSVFLGETEKTAESLALPPLPVRPPVLCAGCPHRASFYAVKQAAKGIPSVFCGDIGCYTLGNAMPLDMVDTCLCMGADLTIAQGIRRADPAKQLYSFIGDSTFFASGITGVVNAVYNQADLILIVLDNSTTAMTGHQPHPGTGKTMMGDVVAKVSIEKILVACGVVSVETVDPLDLEAAVAAVKRAQALSGVRAVIFESPCVAIIRPEGRCTVDTQKCVGCKKCITQLGCPALSMEQGKAIIEMSLCTGCGLCTQLCPCKAIGKKEAK